ncbi:MAG: hypothetical protein V4510_09450 [bacterium]
MAARPFLGMDARLALVAVATLLVIAGFSVAVFHAAPDVQPVAHAARPPVPDPPIRFGMDAPTWRLQAEAGARPDYATLWIGPWNLAHGWRDPNRILDDLYANNVTPAIHFYYWGDDMSVSCLENGCTSPTHGLAKDQAGWQRLAVALAETMNKHLHGKPALVILETEFNKGSVATYEPLDGYLAEKADYLHAAYPQATVVLAFGNWNRAAWSTWDRAAAASDWVGVQALGGRATNGRDDYNGVFESTKSAVQDLRRLFSKPVLIQDVGMSSYPGADMAQALGLEGFFRGLDELRDLNVTAILYRSWLDTPDSSTAEHFGEAERHWGLVGPSGPKLAATIWVDGVKEARR